MKELILLRHAKSSWELNVEDRHRPLTEKGMLCIKRMAQHNPEIFSDLDAIYSSPANRANHTASIAIHSLQLPFEKLALTESLYTFEASQVIHFVKNLSNDLERVMCVGHNPAFTQAVVYFSGKDFDHLPTAAWAHLKFKQTKWSSVQEGTLTLGLPKKILK